VINPLSTLQIYHRPFQEWQKDIALVRETVFHHEQGVDPTLDWDGLDDQCDHFVAYILQNPVGVARLRSLDTTIAKLERVAVLKPWRRLGIGQELVKAAIHQAATQGITTLTLHAQLPSVAFYEALGFIPIGQPFTEADIDHLKMTKHLNSENPMLKSD
jgi:predicted GNAT family N-acyltransferase